MTLWLFFVIVYASIANLAMYMTCREHVQYGNRSVGWTVLGVIACIAWPLVIAAMLVMVAARRKGPVAA
jgi:hypothetical protein